MSAFMQRFGHRLKETIKVAPRSGVDADRNETFGSDVNIAAYVEDDPLFLRNSAGREFNPRAVIFVDISPSVLPTARLTRADGSKPKILHVAKYTQLIPHQEIFI